MAEEDRWLPLESNPEVMNLFLRKLGVPDVWSVQDVWGLEPDLLAMLPTPVLGLMLLFPVNDHYRTAAQENVEPSDYPSQLYYMKQTVSNACGTVALLHCVANAHSTGRLELVPGSPLQVFLEATAGLTPEERAGRLENDAEIVRVHDEAAREGQTAAPNLEDQVDHHFVALVEVEGGVWELDGRRKGGAKLVGKCQDGEFLGKAAAVCKEYMARDPTSLSFTVLALTASD